MPETKTRTRKLTPRLIAGGAAAAVVLLCGLAAAPWPPKLSGNVTGDAALAERVRPLLTAPANQVSVAWIDGDNVRYAGFGADELTEYEIGSVSKTFTSSLLADAVERGEVTLETTVADILGKDLTDPDAEIGTVTLAELASHRSGLPRLAAGIDALPSLLVGQLLNRDPYTATPAQILTQAQSAGLNNRGAVAYSNLGYAFLGQLLAKAAGTSWEELLADRVLTPLALKETYAPVTAENLPDGAPTGRSAAGRPEGAWTLAGSAPAGGIRSTAADLARYAQAQLDGTAPGAAALEPQWGDGDRRYGLGWVTEERGGREITWHNGQTGGFWSMVALDRESGRAVVMLSNVSAGQEEAVFELLAGGPA
ncbi:beta-lactamase family protein [Arthrobacter sp. zg-Y916]|uniref:serine hydrolase domain-containing protein n=1 Tax=Arthrobacter sp. zg-Y916 TaxID=2894190 RepID=UPI001E36F9C4|nr:serine hydrolase domain-containing protein [Arthrobacter sp. zg-Y916]MCC9194392.1 beta-lactamase family protein [Arthrobacter sp. zg-Y916]